MLKTEKTVENGSAKITLGGRLDASTAPQLESELKAVYNGITELVFDLKELDYVSSAGLRVFLSAQKIMNAQGSMKLFNVKDEVMDIFEITGFSDFLTIVK